MTEDADIEVPSTVCLTHMRHVPCRKAGEHELSTDLADVARVAEYHRAPNRTWWIVLTPTAMRELNGVLVTEDGDQVHVLMGPVEEALVRDLARYADPTVDVSVAHGWGQAPAALEELYRVKRSVR